MFAAASNFILVCIADYCTRVGISELKIPYSTVVVVDFADLACGIFLKGKSL